MVKQLNTAQKRGMLIVLGALVLLAGWRWRAAHAAGLGETITDNEISAAPLGLKIDLNTADTTALQQVKGIGAASARRIVRYRSLVGGFTTTEQLLKVWGITPENFVRIEEQVFVDTTTTAFATLRKGKPQKGSYQRNYKPRYPEHRGYKDHPQNFTAAPITSSSASSTSGQAGSATTATQFVATAPRTPARKQLIDINTADSTALVEISGIGPGTARNIVKYRNLIYFYDNLDQLTEVWGIRPENLERMKPFLTIGESRKAMPHLRINEMTVEELGRHKYFGFKEARIVVSYREKHGAFADFAALQNVLGVAPEKWEQLRAYLVF